MRLAFCLPALLLAACSEPECPAVPPPPPVAAPAEALVEPEPVEEEVGPWNPFADDAVAFVAYEDTAQQVTLGTSNVMLTRTVVAGRGEDLHRTRYSPKYSGGVAAIRIAEDDREVYSELISFRVGKHASSTVAAPHWFEHNGVFELVRVEGGDLSLLMLLVRDGPYQTDYRFFAKQGGELRQVGHLNDYDRRVRSQVEIRAIEGVRDSTRVVHLDEAQRLPALLVVDGLHARLPININPYSRSGNVLALDLDRDPASGLAVLAAGQTFGVRCDEGDLAFDLFTSSTGNESWPVVLREGSEAKTLELHGVVEMGLYDKKDRHFPQIVKLSDYRIRVVIDGQEGFMSPGDWASLGMDDVAC